MRVKRSCIGLLALAMLVGTGGAVLAGPGVELTREIMIGYTSPEDPEALYDFRYVAEDVVFMDMASGTPMATNVEDLIQVLHRNYNVSFDATKTDLRMSVGDGTATMEWTVVGTHIGTYKGIPATGNEVRFPIVGVYELQDAWPYRIQRARIYVMESILLAQINAD